MTICPISQFACDCQPPEHECDGLQRLRDACASWKAEALRLRELAEQPAQPNDIHSCSYFCTRPGCVLRQRDELRDRLARTARLNRDQVRDLVKESGLDWHRGFVPLFDGDETNRFEVLVNAALEAAREG